MVDHKRVYTIEDVLKALNNLVEGLQDHRADGTDWAECELCQDQAQEVLRMLEAAL